LEDAVPQVSGRCPAVAGEDGEGADVRWQAGDAVSSFTQASGLALFHFSVEGKGRDKGEACEVSGGVRPGVVGALDEVPESSGWWGGVGGSGGDAGALSGGGGEAEADQGARAGGERGRGSDARVYAACDTGGAGGRGAQATAADPCRDLGPFSGLHGGQTRLRGRETCGGIALGGGGGLPAFSGTFPRSVGGTGSG